MTRTENSYSRQAAAKDSTGLVHVRGAREHNLKNVDLDVAQLDGLVDAGNTVIVVEHEMRIVAGSDWVIDIGPGAAEEGGHVVAAGTPAALARSAGSRTAPT